MPGRTVPQWDKNDSSLGMSRTAQRSWLCNTAGRHRDLLSETSARSGPVFATLFDTRNGMVVGGQDLISVRSWRKQSTPLSGIRSLRQQFDGGRQLVVASPG